LLDIEGDTVAIDAIGCQTNIAGKIREAGADCVLSLKDNRLTLHGVVAEYFDWNPGEATMPNGLAGAFNDLFSLD
jgi:predicted transposase YbfD/YdcC